MRSSVSIVLFFLLSGFFLAALVGAIERNRKLLGVAAACLIVLTSIIVFIKPVQLPSLSALTHGTTTTIFVTPGLGGAASVATPAAPAVSTTAPVPTSTTTVPGTSSTVVPSGYSAGVTLVR